ncbi:type I-E CRISPR-associated protein Cas7/Cse4/CasC [Tessaracoccus sp. OH4464_COT-324]|uniref:type I-E CRISPR-associated protein Cas7/Cse4/CasC n=1 Tax=Tessaracoccus sp. OH4464_COT-324 TaxID=2491059 RepID=UPI000F641179|nr:type I-E CRISPR-associated protein Cas7/Cse4/CasC [Tessaracoccus sp. OH4464_COT-324]RRD45914.1 type I-E CRISPR-associated protein Cas7/Cse4/CasC [Tessaracoccus sp. OH4464_COT-324]
MTTFIEIHALQTVPPSNINRDDTGTPKTAVYGGVVRSRVSSQSWKRAIREDFNRTLDPKDIGTRSRLLVAEIAKLIEQRNPDLGERAEELAVAAMEAAGFKKPVPKAKKKEEAGTPETGYLVFLSQRQLDSLAEAAVEASSEPNPLQALKNAKVKDLVDADHSVDIALFGRMVADSADLNVEAACQVAHALSVHEATPEYDFYTAVDDTRKRDEDAEDAGAGMMGTIGFTSSTLYRYAAVNVDQLTENLGNNAAVQKAVEAFLRSFVAAIPSGKQNSMAHGTRPAAVLVTVAEGQPTNLVGAFEAPVASRKGHLEPAVSKLAQHAQEVFGVWRTPKRALVSGLPSVVGPLAAVGETVSFDDVVSAVLAEISESA